MRFTGAAADAATTFLRQVSEGHVREAYDGSSAVLKAQQSFEEFAAQIDAMGLKDFSSATWPGRRVLPAKAELKGTVRTKSGESIAAEATLLRESGTWRVVAVQLPRSANAGTRGGSAADAAGAAGTTVPPAAQSKELAKQTLSDFASAVETKDFGAFHKTVASLWQQQMSPEEMQKAFQAFIDKKVYLSPVRTVDPIFSDDPKIDERGILSLTGHSPVSPAPIAFDLAYVRENGSWKCVSVHLKISEDTAGKEPTVPSAAELKKLVIGTLLEFNTAVRVRSFDGFHQKASTALQQAQSPKALQKSFQGFIDKNIDVSAVKASTPVFEPEPAIDDQGVLRLTGYFPTTPQVKFKLSYVREGGAWKVFGIGVKRD
jgi:hypothetical protein